MVSLELLPPAPPGAVGLGGQRLPPTPNPSIDSSSSLDFILSEMGQASALVQAGCPVSPSGPQPWAWSSRTFPGPGKSRRGGFMQRTPPHTQGLLREGDRARPLPSLPTATTRTSIGPARGRGGRLSAACGVEWGSSQLLLARARPQLLLQEGYLLTQ